MNILKSINVLVLSFVFLFAVACSGQSTASDSTEEVVEEAVEAVEAVEAAPVMDSTAVEAADSTMVEVEAVDSVAAEG
ncbi:MAG: hypothetical protein OCD76_18810 [Reichenbachiella sp.]